MLRQLQLLDKPAAQLLSDITRLAAEVLNGSSAMVSLLDNKSQHLHARSGIEVTETPLEVSFCLHCVEADRPMLVEDAATDPRFAQNPLVTGAPFIRSYAGIPVHAANGIPLGTLCVISPEPGAFDEQSLARLGPLAQSVEGYLALLDRNLELERLNVRLAEQTIEADRKNVIFRQSADVGGTGVWQIDLETSELHWSDQVYRIHGIPVGTHVSVDDAIECYLESERDMVRAAVDRAMADDVPYTFEASIMRPDGAIRRVRSMGERVSFEGEADRMIGVIYDITEAHDTYETLKHTADHDSLTGLLNRHAFDLQLSSKIRKFDPWRGPFHVILIDLDGFKDVNDFFGHLVGDLVLKKVASRLQGALAKGDVLARWGGDEFVVVTEQGKDPEHAIELAERLIEAISPRIEVGGNDVSVGASCGISSYLENLSAKELLRRADLALYHGKAREPGRAHAYRREFEADMKNRQVAIDSVRSAIADDRLFAAYQPIIELESRKVVGLESLLRLHDENGDVLTASNVQPALLEPALSRRVFDSMLASICNDLKRLKLALPDLEFLSINVTEADLLCRDFMTRFLDRLQDAGIEPGDICLEFTEMLLMVNDTNYVKQVLAQLRQAGVSIALDDFGTGFSSLSHLRDFPIDRVKIDKSFVAGLTLDHSNLAIVQALIAMSQNLSIDIVAEGIESERDCASLIELGCKLGQGFHFSPASSVERIEALAEGIGEPGETA